MTIKAVYSLEKAWSRNQYLEFISTNIYTLYYTSFIYIHPYSSLYLIYIYYILHYTSFIYIHTYSSLYLIYTIQYIQFLIFNIHYTIYKEFLIFNIRTMQYIQFLMYSIYTILYTKSSIYSILYYTYVFKTCKLCSHSTVYINVSARHVLFKSCFFGMQQFSLNPDNLKTYICRSMFKPAFYKGMIFTPIKVRINGFKLHWF